MADSIKIGNLDISAFKVGSSDCKIYLGDTLLYPQSPTPPTPTYQWVSYNEGDTVPSTIFYGVKLYGLDGDGEIDFSVDGHSGVAFIFDTSNYEWTAIDITSQNPIDISEYFDETEGCYIIYFSNLGYGGMPVEYPQVGYQFEFDVQLYEEHTTTLQWVTFNNGDTIPSDLDIYGVSGNAFDISSSFAYNSECFFTPDRNRIDVEFWCNGHICYSDNPLYNDTLEYIFSNLGCCDSYKIGGTASGGGIQLYVYA